MNDELAHYGVKGMKWGVRKSVEPAAGDVSGGGGGGGAPELDEETQKLLKDLSEGKIDWSALSDDQRATLSGYLSTTDANARKVLGEAGKAVGDYVQHLPSDGIFQFTRKDGTGLLNTEADAERYRRHEKSKADVQAFAERTLERRKESEAAGEAAVQKYRTSPGSTHTDTKDYGTYEVTSVYRNDSRGTPQRVGSRAKNKDTGQVSYTNTMPFGIGTNSKEIDDLIDVSEKRENQARKYARSQYDKRFRHDALDGDTLYLVHHGVKGMKWGVRRTPAQLGRDKVATMAKRQAKADAYRSKADTMMEQHNASVRSANSQLKRAKYVAKLGKYEKKAGKHAFTDIGVWRRENAARKANRMRGKIHEIDSGSQRFNAKVNKLNTKANRLELRNKRVGKRLSKKLNGVKVTDLTQEQKEVGRRYVEAIIV